MYNFIINPHARSGLGHSVWKELQPILEKRNIIYKAYFTKYQNHATELTKKITSDGNAHTLIGLGGDGTINEIINGVADFDKIILGYIPIGSSNDFARSMNIPSDPKEALECILASHDTHALNIGILNYQNRQKHFAVSAGIGFDAAICHEAMVSKLKISLNRLHLGKFTYAGIALHRLFLTTPQKMTVTLDHHKEITFSSAYFAAVMNHKYEGGGVKFCPDALPDDNQLDVIVVSDVSKLKILALLPTAFSGRHTHFNGVHIYRCRHVHICVEHALPVHTDGEPVFLQRSISASCDAKMLQLIVPERR